VIVETPEELLSISGFQLEDGVKSTTIKRLAAGKSRSGDRGRAGNTFERLRLYHCLWQHISICQPAGRLPGNLNRLKRLDGARMPMARSQKNPIPLCLRPEIDFGVLPVNSTLPQGEEIVSHYVGTTSKRTIREWPLEWRRYNGRHVTNTRALIAEAQRRFDSGPVRRGDKEPTPATAPAEAQA
jgi:hypothetical protein